MGTPLAQQVADIKWSGGAQVVETMETRKKREWSPSGSACLVLFSSLFPFYPKVFLVLYEVFRCLEMDEKATFIIPVYGYDITAKNKQSGRNPKLEWTNNKTFILTKIYAGLPIPLSTSSFMGHLLKHQFTETTSVTYIEMSYILQEKKWIIRGDVRYFKRLGHRIALNKPSCSHFHRFFCLADLIRDLESGPRTIM